VTGDGSGTLLILGLVLLIVGGVHLAKEYLNERPITLEHMGITSRSKSGPIKYDRTSETWISTWHIDVTNSSDEPRSVYFTGPFISALNAFGDREIIGLGRDMGYVVKPHSRLRRTHKVSSEGLWGYELSTIRPHSRKVIVTGIDDHDIAGIHYDRTDSPVFNN
jgi:hypothetical protein